MRIFLAIIMLILIPLNLMAQVQMVTRPERASVELTIYNSRDLTLVREQRNITLKSGENLLQFSWADTLIDPTSIQIKPVDPASDVKVISAIFPPGLSNTIQWQVDCGTPGEKVLEVSYFTSGLTWEANYIALLDSTEKTMTLNGSVTISNRSGEDYENAETRLIVGDVRLVEEVRALATGGGGAQEKLFETASIRKAMAPAPRGRGEAELADRAFALPAAPPAVAETQAISEYYIYILKGRDTIKHDWRKRKLSFTVDQIPIETIHRFGEYGENVIRFYQFKNDDEHKLGKEPLPKGNIKVFIKDASGALSKYIGDVNIDFIPVGKEAKLQMGQDPEVKIKKRQMDIRRINLQFDEKDRRLIQYDTERDYTFEIENYKAEEIKLEIKENLGRDWEILQSSHKYEKKDANSIEFKLNLPAGGKDKIEYKVRFQGR